MPRLRDVQQEGRGRSGTDLRRFRESTCSTYFCKFVKGAEGENLWVAPDYRKLWGAWLGREEELYRAAAEIVGALTPEDFVRVGGSAAAARLERVGDRHRKIADPELPPVLQRNPGLRVRRESPDDYLVVSFSSNQPFRMARQLYECLDYFDGSRTVDEVAVRLEEERRVTLAAELVTKLYPFRILTAPAP